MGRDLGDVAGLNKRLNIRVLSDAVKALRAAKPDVVIHCIGSSIKKAHAAVRERSSRRRRPIVSTNRGALVPGYTHIRQAGQIHAWAKKAKVAVLGTGVNPGFAMDTLPIMLTAVCERVDRVHVTRVQDARSRRLPFQQKIGAGPDDRAVPEARSADGSVRHVGLTESIAMIADALGLDARSHQRRRAAEAGATVTVASEFLAVDPGYVCGIVQDGVGYRKGQPAIRLHMEAYLGAPETLRCGRRSKARRVCR